MGELRDPARRQTRICGILSDRGSVSVADLSRELGVSEVTVRKDLTQLESRGLLKRHSGGAYTTMKYAQSIGIKTLNLYDKCVCEDSDCFLDFTNYL